MIFLGIGVGYGVAEPISLATNRRSGTALQIIAVIGVFVAYFVRNLAAGDALIVTNDIYGFLVRADRLHHRCEPPALLT